MYSSEFCNVYDWFGWNYFPMAFGEELLQWLRHRGITVGRSLDLGCGTGVLCALLRESGIDAWGMDLSEGMIGIARERDPAGHYEVADMVRYRPDVAFDLITCTGDALNHISDLGDIAAIFGNVHAMLRPGGHFVFDVLRPDEVSPGEAFEVDFSDTVRARFGISRLEDGRLQLRTAVFENGVQQFEECITETVHDHAAIRQLLAEAGLELLQSGDRLLPEAEGHSTTCYMIARRPE